MNLATNPKPSGKTYRAPWRVRRMLVELYPSAFMPHGAQKKPLKIGIDKEIAGFTRRELWCAFNDYTSGPTYLRNVVTGAHRVGLDGVPCGSVTEDDEWHAKRMLARFERDTIREPLNDAVHVLNAAHNFITNVLRLGFGNDSITAQGESIIRGIEDTLAKAKSAA